MIAQILNFITELILYMIKTLYQDGIYLFISILVGAILTVYIDTEKARKLFLRKPKFLIPGSVSIAALTPLCACGTMAVVFSLISGTLPWGPIMAFLVSSPLMSPDTFVLLSGFMGVGFATALAISSIILGLVSGFLTYWIEKRTSFLDDQLKNRRPIYHSQCCSGMEAERTANSAEYLYKASENVRPVMSVACINSPHTSAYCSPVRYSSGPSLYKRLKLRKLMNTFYDLGIRKVLPLFTLFIAIAYVLKTFVPSEWIMNLFSGNNFYSVPLASVIGLPLYISDGTSVPLLKVLKDAGASEGALLAFMISGPATSLGVVAGLNLIMKKKAIIIYISYILGGSILLGYAYDAILLMIL